ncbi:hypothetical protein [Neptuniibacter marinus]|uniref:hypothetical protein n=1 Tax=Neptuniibacter marinus TaxID=1806670 RepID=UPI00083774F8|nr:hypothetical protein [Neptuniibacter marinus]
MYLAIIEQFLFLGGLLVYLVSLAMYAGRTKDYKSLIEFWKPTINMTKREFNVNRAGLTMMVAAVAIRIINFLI